MRKAVALGLIVFALQLAALFSTAALFSRYGGSLAHEVAQQDAAKFMGVADAVLTDGYFHAAGRAVPDTWLTPGYPLFVAGTYLLSGHSLWTLLIVLAALGALASVVIYGIGCELGLKRSYAFAAGLLFGVSPAVIWIPPSGMGSDILFALLFAFSAYLLARLPRAGSPWLSAIAIGIALGLSALVRPLGLYFSFIIIVAIPFFSAREESRGRKLAAAACALLAFCVALSPWLLRNERVAGHFALSSQFAFNPFYYNIPLFLAAKNHSDESMERTKLIEEVAGIPWDDHRSDSYPLVNGFTYYDRMASFDREFLKENLLPYLKFHLYKTIPFFAGSGVNVVYATIRNEIPSLPPVAFLPPVEQNTSSLFYGGNARAVAKNLLTYWPSTLERIGWLVLFALAFLAPFLTRGLERRFAVLSVALIIAVALFSSPIAQPRYRVPAEPFLWLSAMLSVSVLMRRQNLPRLFS